jgi:hypothetical protein
MPSLFIINEGFIIKICLGIIKWEQQGPNYRVASYLSKFRLASYCGREAG